jgi:hypothetical protein
MALAFVKAFLTQESPFTGYSKKAKNQPLMKELI